MQSTGNLFGLDRNLKIPLRMWAGIYATSLHELIIGAFLKTRHEKSPLSKLCQTINPTRNIRGRRDKPTPLCAETRQLIKISQMVGNVPKRMQMSLLVAACQRLFSYLDLPFSHDLVHNLIVVLVQHAFVITLLVAEDPQVLGALELNLKLLLKSDREK